MWLWVTLYFEGHVFEVDAWLNKYCSACVRLISILFNYDCWVVWVENLLNLFTSLPNLSFSLYIAHTYTHAHTFLYSHENTHGHTHLPTHVRFYQCLSHTLSHSLWPINRRRTWFWRDLTEWYEDCVTWI